MRILLLVLMAGALMAQSVNVNAGGGAVSDSGNVFVADRYFTGGNAYATVVAGKPLYYSTQRYGNFVYEIPAAAGEYEVVLHFYEVTSTVNGVGQRVFKVNVNGVDELPSMDIWKEANGRGPVVWSKKMKLNGVLRVQFTTLVKNAVVSAIALVKLPDPPVVAPAVLTERVETFRITVPEKRLFVPRFTPALRTCLMVYRNGVLQTVGEDYVETMGTLQFLPWIDPSTGEQVALPRAGDLVTLHYWSESSDSAAMVIQPPTAKVDLMGSTQFVALDVKTGKPEAVTWSVTPPIGWIDANGRYFAPAMALPRLTPVAVTHRSWSCGSPTVL